MPNATTLTDAELLNPLPADVARCRGMGSEENGDWYWLEGCEHCLRRTSPPVDPERVLMMQPPRVIAFECEFLIPSNSAELHQIGSRQ